jgi:hypothetical protein
MGVWSLGSGVNRPNRRRFSPALTIEGMIEIKTESGQSVSIIKKGQYEIVQTGEILASDDPKAL